MPKEHEPRRISIIKDLSSSGRRGKTGVIIENPPSRRNRLRRNNSRSFYCTKSKRYILKSCLLAFSYAKCASFTDGVQTNHGYCWLRLILLQNVIYLKRIKINYLLIGIVTLLLAVALWPSIPGFNQAENRIAAIKARGFCASVPFHRRSPGR